MVFNFHFNTYSFKIFFVIQLVLVQKTERQERAIFVGNKTLSVPVKCQDPYELYVHSNNGDNLTMNIQEFLDNLTTLKEPKLEFRRNQPKSRVIT